MAPGVGEIEQELGRAQSYIKNEHVQGEQCSAIGTACSVVEPAFRHHVNARETHPGDQAYERPRHWMYEGTLHQDRGGSDRRKSREHADMAHTADQSRCRKGTEQVPYVVAGHDDARNGSRKTF